MGPCFWYVVYNAVLVLGVYVVRIPNEGPMLRDHGIYLGFSNKCRHGGPSRVGNLKLANTLTSPVSAHRLYNHPLMKTYLQLPKPSFVVGFHRVSIQGVINRSYKHMMLWVVSDKAQEARSCHAVGRFRWPKVLWSILLTTLTIDCVVLNPKLYMVVSQNRGTPI